MWIATCAALLILLPQDTPSTKARPRAAREQPSAEKELKRKQAAFETKAPEEKELDDARRRSIGLLVGMQESLDPARKEPCEWPYEGVYRVPGESGKPEIPIGYRVGGTSIVCSALLRALPEKLDKLPLPWRFCFLSRARRPVVVGVVAPQPARTSPGGWRSRPR